MPHDVRPPALVAARTVGALGLLTLALPLNLALTVPSLLRGPPERRQAERPLTVLVSGGKMTKALQLCRSFHRAGHRVVLVEQHKYRFTGHRFSRDVDVFRTVPAPQDEGYAQALLDLVIEEGVDVYVPVCSPVASWQDARAAEVLKGHCEVVHGDADTVRALDDKDAFAALARSLDLPVPDTHRITSPEQVAEFTFPPGESWVLKSIAYDPVHRLDLTRLPRPTPQETAAFARSKPISPDNPWILQRFVAGTEYCTHATARDGVVQVHLCCTSSAFQVNYEMVDKPEIEQWVRRFVGALGLTGQFSFDFIETEDGDLRAIECNPRTHSAITMLYDHPDVARAYLEPDVRLVTPTSASRPTYWAYHEAWRLLSQPREVLKAVANGKDAIYDVHDPLPFLVLHHVQVPWLLLGNLVRGKDWIRIDFNIGKLVEAAGD